MVTGKPATLTEASRNRKFGAHVRRLREQKGISLREAARRLAVSPALLSKAERGQVDFRKPSYVDRLAAVLDANANDLRHAAGLETLEWEEVWSRVQNLGADLIGLRLRDARDQRLFRVLGFILLIESLVASVAREPGKDGESALQEMQEILRMVLVVAERRHGGVYSHVAETKDEAVRALHRTVDVALDGLYAVHKTAIEELLESK